ncbi:phage portal protein [Bacillus methanolicus]|uniref:phage portal protein n=1 Tax=Bacillus methanolicus TaxID=1471 RepID=UPI00237FEF1D|nr:phage portal protein [Bacillus methanolicus]
MLFKSLLNSVQTWEQPLFDAFVTPTMSGETITNDNALTIGAVYACVNIKANAIAKLPLQVFKKTKSGRERENTHQVAYLLEKRPNPYMTPFVFKHTITVHRNLWGKAYIRMVMKGGNVSELVLLDPSKTIEAEDDKGDKWFIYRDKGKEEKFHHTEIIYLPYGPGGKSPIEVARETAGTMKAAQKFLGTFYKNGTTTRGIIKVLGQLNGEAKKKLRASWAEVNSGLDNAHSIAVLDSGMEWMDISMPLKDAEFIASQKFNIAEIARIFNVPLHMLNELDRSTFSNIEHQSMEFIQNTIQPELVAWEEEMNYKLFTTNEQKRFYVKFNLTSALRGDSQSRAQYYKEMLSSGVYNINEVRALEEMDAIEGGDKHRVDLNHISIDIADEYQLAKAGATSKGGENGEE